MNDTTDIKDTSQLTSGDFTERAEPFALFADWFAEAVKSEPNDPNAMALATVDADGLPDVRMVLMKGYDTDGFVFYSHIASQKGRDHHEQANGALGEARPDGIHGGDRRVPLHAVAPDQPVHQPEEPRFFGRRGRRTEAGRIAGGAKGGQVRPADDPCPAARSDDCSRHELRAPVQ